TCLQAEVLDSSKGYVCRLTCSKEYHIPEKPDMISAELFPLMKLTLQIKLFTAGNHKKLYYKTFKMSKRDQAKKHKNSVFATQDSETVIKIPQTFTISSTKKTDI
ncbi:hypothetical protein INT45_013828, partial [Circinella minor]